MSHTSHVVLRNTFLFYFFLFFGIPGAGDSGGLGNYFNLVRTYVYQSSIPPYEPDSSHGAYREVVSGQSFHSQAIHLHQHYLEIIN